MAKVPCRGGIPVRVVHLGPSRVPVPRSGSGPAARRDHGRLRLSARGRGDRPGAYRAPERGPPAGGAGAGRRLGPGGVGHALGRRLPRFLRPGDLLVVNETRVLPARLHLVKGSGGGAEVLLLEPSDDDPGPWEALVRPGRRLPAGTLLWEEDAGRTIPSARARAVAAPSGVRLRGPGGRDRSAGIGIRPRRRAAVRSPARRLRDGPGRRMPLPPYIHAPLADPDRYQTVFAADLAPGDRSSAAPTAGLHLTPDVLDALGSRGVGVATVDLAIGLDTFRPVTAATPDGHTIHTERYSVPASTLEACGRARRVVAVGTTAVRALESAASTGRLSGRTDLFIHGDFRFRVVDVLLTNFHLPRSSLLLMVEAFYGPGWRPLYDTALARGYRFLSFGDAMLIGRDGSRPGGPAMTATTVEVTATDGAARAGTVHTARGSYRIPTFMPVGTRGAVKALDSRDLEALGAEVVLANTYHLMLRPGADVVADLGGLHRFTGWTGHTLTDSGGFQVHSLSPEVDDDGVLFASVYDGPPVRLTPESAVEAQGLLGADIQMVLDVCATLPATPEVLRTAVERTAAWAARARRTIDRLEARPEGQALFGIVQGGTDPALRVESARRTVELGFDGYGIGGLSVGEPRPAMLEALAATVPRAAGRPAAVPHGGGGPGGAGGGHRPRRRPVRLRGADPDGPTRCHPDLRRSAEPAERRPRPGRLPLGRRVPMSDLCTVVTGLPAPPAGGQRAHGMAPAQHPQPGLHARPGGRARTAIERGDSTPCGRKSPTPGDGDERSRGGAGRWWRRAPGRPGLQSDRCGDPDPLPRPMMLHCPRRPCSPLRARRPSGSSITVASSGGHRRRLLLPHPAAAAAKARAQREQGKTWRSATRS